ncbi:MAG TPA: alpha/beta hydrolase [Polyangiaceae bacterium]
MVLAAPAAENCEPPTCESTNTCPTSSDVKYGAHLQQELDVYVRTGGGTGRAPVILFVHPGLVEAGENPTSADRAIPDALRAQRAKGWAIVSVSYRSPPTFVAPDPVRDIKRAIMYLRANPNKTEFSTLNASHIVIAGVSGGSLLSGMTGVTQGVAEYNPTDLSGVAGQSSAVKGMIIFQAPDLAIVANSQVVPDPVACHGNPYLNCKINGVTATGAGCKQPTNTGTCTAAQLKRGSPHQFVTTDDPPVYLAYGTADGLAPPSSGDGLALQYISKGIGQKVWYDLIENGPHSAQYTGVNLAAMECFLRETINPADPCECTTAPALEYCKGVVKPQ